MTILPGEFWLADIPFTDGSSSKKRPVLVLWLDGSDAVAAVVTSAMPRTATDVALVNWKASGLRVQSTIRLSRLDSLEQSLFLHRVGVISPRDAAAIRQVWANEVKPKF